MHWHFCRNPNQTRWRRLKRVLESGARLNRTVHSESSLSPLLRQKSLEDHALSLLYSKLF